MKKRTVLILLSLCVSLTACGKTAAQFTQADIENMNEVETPKNNEVNYNVLNETISGDFTDVVLLDEILNAEMFSDIIQINNNIVSAPFEAAELEKLGVKPMDYSMDLTVEPKELNSLYCELGNGQLVVNVENNDADRKTFRDSMVYELYQCTTDNIYLPKGIHVGSTIKELENVYGKPIYKDDSCDRIKYMYVHVPTFLGSDNYSSGDNKFYNLQIDKETNKIVQMQIGLGKDYISSDYRNIVDIDGNDYEITYPEGSITGTVGKEKYYKTTVAEINGKKVTITIPVLQNKNSKETFVVPFSGCNSIREEYDLYRLGHVVRSGEIVILDEILEENEEHITGCKIIRKDNTLKINTLYCDKNNVIQITSMCYIGLDNDDKFCEETLKYCIETLEQYSKSVHRINK